MSESLSYAGLASALTKGASNLVKESFGRSRAEDFLSALAAVTGELVLRATDFDLNSHNFLPGERVYLGAVNRFLFNDTSDWARVDVTSTFGAIRQVLSRSDPLYWSDSCFPDIAVVQRLFAETPPMAESWGWVPLSVPSEHRPRLQPLRVARELRAIVVESPRVRNADPKLIASIGSVSTIKALLLTKESISPALALSIVFETINGMSRTVPVTPRQLEAAFSGTQATPELREPAPEGPIATSFGRRDLRGRTVTLDSP